MFFAALFMLAIGFPVAFTFGAVSVFFGFLYGVMESFDNGGSFFEGLIIGKEMFDFMPFRIFSIMENFILIAVPLFVFMGIVLERTKLAEKMLESMGKLFGNIRGGVAISTILVGALLAASTGVVGASIVAMGVISLPVMLKYNYDKRLSTGTICAAGTLGQIIPPSLVLIVLGDVFAIPVGNLFKAAVIPGLSLVGIYIVFILVISFFKKELAPVVPQDDNMNKIEQIKEALFHILPPLILIVLVLGSIFGGFATPTESSAVGCIGAILLSILYKTFSFKMIKEVAIESSKITAMVFAILIGATAFSMVFAYTGGDVVVEEFMMNLPGSHWGFIIFSMIAILILGFFIDFIEISYIILPILVPIADNLGINPLWFALLVTLNLQTSFLTPPFGFSLFYLKGVAPPEIRTSHIYKGVLPFILLQIIILMIMAICPEIFGIKQML